MVWKTKRINFNHQMEQDFESIRTEFKTLFNIEPSNTEIQQFLLKVFREKKPQIVRKNRSKEWFVI